MSEQRLFISHASEDEAVVNRIVAYLEANGVACWISSRDIPPRSIYAEAITDGVESCSACAVIVSEAANASDAVKRELELASHFRKPFVPIRIDATEPGRGLAYYLRNAQWIDYRREGERALDRIVSPPSRPQPPLTRSFAPLYPAPSSEALSDGATAGGAWRASAIALALFAGLWLLYSFIVGQRAPEPRVSADAAIEAPAFEEPPAAEEPAPPSITAPAATRRSVVGTWNGTTTDQRGTRPLATFVFDSAGAFSTSVGKRGTWRQHGSQVRWEFFDLRDEGQYVVASVEGDQLVGNLFWHDGTHIGTLQASREPE